VTVKKFLATLLLATTVSSCDALFGEDGVPVETVVFDRTWLAAVCITGETTTTGTRSTPPCVTSTTTTTQTQVDSSRLTLTPGHVAIVRLGNSTRPLGCPTCAAPADVTTLTGTYDIIADSIVVTLPAPGLNGATRLAFFSDIPDRVQPYYIGPDSLMFKVNAQGRFLLYR
jgi:hypothetical protein